MTSSFYFNQAPSRDEEWMVKALKLAQFGSVSSMPNPRVGCIIVKYGELIGEGWHKKAGEPHAERIALNQAGTNAKNSEVYITLEPCAHQGRTPPCADALIKAQVSRVIIPHLDPDPRVSGKGVAKLEAAGIEVLVGICEKEARYLNRGFLSRVQRNKPWVILKIALSLDGKIALKNGDSQWISSIDSRQDAHQRRAESCAILTGIGTVLRDNPELTVRHILTERQPLRIIMDKDLRTPISSKMCISTNLAPTLIVTEDQNLERHQLYQKQGVEILVVPSTRDWHILGDTLAKRGINYILVEAGSTIIKSLEEQDWVDEYLLYYAPIFLGNDARNVNLGVNLEHLHDARRLNIHHTKRLGNDLCISALHNRYKDYINAV
jgi:diaminohydroxyphosphoribosylaminopyrimidine deaminase/5-amino-6-(5-phosphoribosylamino)uracil reductase